MSRKPIEDGFKDIKRGERTAKYMAELRHRLRRLQRGACVWSGCEAVPKGKRHCEAHNALVNERNKLRRLNKKLKLNGGAEITNTLKSKCSCNYREFFPAKVKAIVNGYERIISFKTGYICETPFNQGSSHGRHGMELIFVLKGGLGVIQFVVYTHWMPNWGINRDEKFDVMPADIGRHNLKKKYDHETPKDGCNWLDGKLCYYDGSGLQAEEVFKIFVSKGEEALWAELESYYKSWIIED